MSELVSVLPESACESMHAEFALAVAPTYPDWEYHNWDMHAKTTEREFLRLAKYCQQHGIDLHPDEIHAGRLAALGHDAGIAATNLVFFEFPEERAANITFDEAILAGFDERSVAYWAGSMVLATQPGAECKTLLDKMMRRADLANLAWDYPHFLTATVNVWRESLRQCPEISFREWLPAAGQFIVTQFLDVDLALGDFDRGHSGQSRFHETAYRNFDQIHRSVQSGNFIDPVASL